MEEKNKGGDNNVDSTSKHTVIELEPEGLSMMKEQDISEANLDTKPTTKAIEFNPKQPVVSVSGGGMLLPWYFGALKAITEVRGAGMPVFASFSSGALACAVLLCGLEHETVGRRYTEIMDEHSVSKRLFGLAFVWGDITRKWLEEILPRNAAERCEGSLVVHVLEWQGILSGFEMRRVNHFPDRSTLIQTLLASCHIPFYLDGRPWTTLTTTGGENLPQYTFKAIDCVILYILKMKKSEEAKIRYRISTGPDRKPDMTISFTFDESLNGGPGVLDIINYEEGMELRDKGYKHTLERLKDPEFSHLLTSNV